MGMVEVQLADLRVQLPTNTPVVILKEIGGRRRSLHILIGQAEATAIALVLKGVEPPRPMTHDLMRILVEELGAKVERIVVTELVGHTYHAEIHLSREGRTFTVSARPSDAVALAIRTRSPIFCDDDLIESEGEVEETAPEVGQEDEIVSQFRQFIDEVRPEDFAS